MRKPSTLSIVRFLVYLQAAGAAAISFSHIVSVGQRYGLTWEAWVAPLLIDGFAILGAIGRGQQFSGTTRRTGFKLMLGAGVVSLVCNVHAGTNIGQQVFGVLVVAGFVTAEWYASRLAAAPAPTPDPDEELAARRSAAARKAAQTRKANQLAAQRAVKAAERETRRAAREHLAAA